MKQIRQILVGSACLLAMAASAQWQWIDKDGRKVFSDRAPPTSVPDKHILQRPDGQPAAAAPGVTDLSNSSAAAPTAKADGVDAPQISGVDQSLAEKKKKAEEAEAAKRKAEEARILKAKVENCARAKQAKASLDSGVRIARTNAKGEREILDDAARAAENQRIATIIEADCR